MLVFLLSLFVLSVHGQNDNHQDETLRKVLSEVLSEVNILKETMGKMQVENADLQDETNKLRATMGKMQVENADLQDETDKLRATMGKMQDETVTKLETLTGNIERMRATDSTLEHDIQELNRSRLMEPLICFSAVKTSVQEASAGDNILFEEELIDTHDTYNPTYGVYVIPQHGVYEVIVTLFKPGTNVYNDVYGDLYAGDTFLARVRHAVDSGSGARFQSTSSIIQELRAGDALHVVSYTNTSFHGAPDYRTSQFSAKYLGPAPSP